MIIKASALSNKLHSRILSILGMFGMLLFATLLLPTAAHAAPTYAGGIELGWDQSGGADCEWQSASIIVCEGFAFGFDAPASLATNPVHAVFRLVADGGGSAQGKSDLTAPSDWFLHFTERSDEAFISKSASEPGTIKTDNITNDSEGAKRMELATGGSSNKDPGGVDTKDPGDFKKDTELHLYQGEQVYAICGLYLKNNQTCFNTASTRGYKAPFNEWRLTSDTNNDMEKIRSIVFGYIDSRDDCGRDAGSLSFILCPIVNTSQTAVKKLIGSNDANGTGKGFLVQLLTISPLSNDTGQNIYKIWLTFRNIALSLYVLIFVAIVFGNGVGLDPYTIKRALPRLATAVLLTFASYFILQTLVDLSNLMGTAIPALVQSITGTTGGSAYQFDFNLGEAGLTIVLAIFVALAALVAVIVGLAGLVARQMIIYALVLVSPIAFAAWVLPNTEGLFKKWWSNLIKVLAMFPIITGMLSLAIMYSHSVSSDSSLAVQISAMLAPMLALVMIPKTFKWGGELFAFGAGAIAGRASKGVDFAKGQGKDRAGKSFGDGLGARGLRAIGTKADENGNRTSRVGFGKVPGVGGTIERKRAIKQAKRDVAIGKRLGAGLDDVSEANLSNIYTNLGPKKQDTAYGKTVKTELSKRKGKAMGEYASALRDGRFDDANRSIDKISTVDKALFPAEGDRRTTGRHNTADGSVITSVAPGEKALPRVSEASAAQLRTVQQRISRQVGGDIELEGQATNQTATSATTASQPLPPHNPAAYQGPGWGSTPAPPPSAPAMPIGPVLPGGGGNAGGGPQYHGSTPAPAAPAPAAPAPTPAAPAPAPTASTSPPVVITPSATPAAPTTSGPVTIVEGETINNIHEAPQAAAPTSSSTGNYAGIEGQLREMGNDISAVRRSTRQEDAARRSDEIHEEFHPPENGGPLPPDGE
jgi:hypothetical protein